MSLQRLRAPCNITPLQYDTAETPVRRCKLTPTLELAFVECFPLDDKGTVLAAVREE